MALANIPPRSRRVMAVVLGLVLASPVDTAAAHQDPEALKKQQIEYAKQQFQEGEQAMARHDYKAAVQKYLEAYRYAPELHVFNYNIGLAYDQAGDCANAKTYFQRFLDLVASHPARGTAQEKLLEIERKGCVVAPQTKATATPEPTPEEEDPLAAQQRQGEADQAAAEERVRKEGEGKYRFNTLMIAGIATGSIGAVLVIAGIATGVTTHIYAKQLADFGKAGPIGFSSSSYADDAVFRKDVARNTLGWTTGIILPVGGVLLVTGTVLYFLGLRKCKREFNAGAAAFRMEGVAPSVGRNGAGMFASLAFGGQLRGGDAPRSRRFGRCDR